MGNYVKLSSEEIEKKISLLIKMWCDFLAKTIPTYHNKFMVSKEDVSQMEAKDLYEINLFALREVFERTHQREDYFDRYHDKLKMSDFKEIGLIAFWISKLKPFHLKLDCFYEAFSLRINEEFALYYIFNSLANYTTERNQQYKIRRINFELYNELLYTMQYRDLSKEAYGCIVELIYIAMLND